MSVLLRFILLLPLFSFPLVSFAQTIPASCPSLTVEGPYGVPTAGSIVEFRVTADKSSETAPVTFNWSVSSGIIIDGQGTDRIRVSGSQSITAVVDTATDLWPCENGASETVNYYDPPSCGLAIDDYGEISKSEENALIDNHSIRARSDPNSTFFFYLDVMSDKEMETARSRAKFIVARFKYRDNKFDTSRLIFGVRRGEQHRTFVYSSSPGASLPECKDGCVQFNGSELRP